MSKFEKLLNVLRMVGYQFGHPDEFEVAVASEYPGRGFTITVTETVGGHQITCGGGSSLEEASQDVLALLEECLIDFQYTVPDVARKWLPKPSKKG